MAKTRKRCLGLALAVLMLAAAGTAVLAEEAVTTNLLLNPGFEEVTTKGALAEWGNPAELTIVKSGDDGYQASPNGGNYVHLGKTESSVSQTISEKIPEGNYMFSVYVKYSAASTQVNSRDVAAVVTLRLSEAAAAPQSAGNNYSIYNTRGEWRRISQVISVPEENQGLTVELRYMEFAVPDLCYDGASLVRMGDYDADALIQYSMDDAAEYNGVMVPTEMIPYSVWNVGDKSYGVLGTNYKATTDTPDGSAYAMEMVNTGTGDDANLAGVGMMFYTGTVHAQATYEISGWVNVDSDEGYLRIENDRIKVDGNIHSKKDFYDTDGWKKFTFKVRPNLTPLWKYTGSEYWTEKFPYAVKLMFTGTGTVKLDDVCITRILDENRIGYNNNIASGGDFESIAEMTADGVAKPDTNLWKAQKMNWTNDVSAAGAMLETETIQSGETNTYLRYTQNRADASLSYMQLSNAQLIPGKLYNLSFKMRYSVFAEGTEGKFFTPNLDIKFEMPKVVSEDGTVTYCPISESNSKFGEPSETEAWTEYSTYIRYPEKATPENVIILFRPYGSQSANYDWTIAVDMDDVALCMVEDAETYGTAAFTENEEDAAVTVSRTLLHNGTTTAEWAAAKEYTVISAAYVLNGTTRTLHDIKMETKTVTMNTKGVFTVPVNASQTVNVPTSGTYTVETYIWDSTVGLVPLDSKTVMP